LNNMPTLRPKTQMIKIIKIGKLLKKISFIYRPYQKL
jgi:hypothetical protein